MNYNILKMKKWLKKINIFSRPIQYLGRWSLEYNHEKIAHRVSMANEDHCSCDFYITQKRNEKIKKKIK